MKRALSAIFCCAFLLANPRYAMADAVFDQDMASRYLRSAQSGDDEAQFYVGALYSAGIGVPRSDEEAFRWFSRAADQGHAHAMLILSGLYAVGRGAPKDNIKAYKWAYIVNGASRVEEFRNVSRQLIGVLERRMSPDEINYAKAEAGRWRPVASGKRTETTAPSDFSRSAPVAPAAPATAAAAPAPAPAAPAPAAPSPQPPAKTASDDSPLEGLGKNVTKGDIDDFLKEVPGLRKKFGF
jgi:TPR repeat protein